MHVFLLITLLLGQYDFTIARLKYGGGGDWYADPSSLPNLLAAVNERTTIRATPREATVEITDPELFSYPYLYMTGHGNVRFTEEEVAILRNYFAAGGFLHADDNYGMDSSFRREIKKVFPDSPLIELPFDHPIYSSFYTFTDGLPKIHEHDGKPAQGFGIFYDNRLTVFYTYECDLGDGWEDPGVHDDPPEKREAALQMGVNIVVYSLTQ
ncbi:hypothetical protein AMJ87_08150 [candidate division WOR_3 bacterium SM23_60]|uniref:DUF4159 domain-containing protein n=1 Tax=candidate division WOR_3 bacterium SM23_60 TaxID=1703780 RepID=A0A0S8GFG4_UNCW3|nr:MAG: hypothetical protein AMJ87_08150 [candidate division WOR_3 bacterium SM23_60]